jgi:response regulator RpfG family c-di-GMP phosphodiesterase
MATKILIQSGDAEVASLVRSLLEPFGYETHVAADVAAISALARRHGPIDLVLLLDPDPVAAEVRARLKEVAPDFKLLSLPAVDDRPPEAASPDSGFLLETTELMDLIEGVLAAAGTTPVRPSVTVDSLRTALVETVLTYSLLLEQFGFINGGNSRLVMEYAVRVARELGLSSALADEVALAALLQDLGIVKARARARARGESDEEAGPTIEQHPIQGANLIQRMQLPWRIRHIVLAHHEWYNGLGYPHGIKGREIPLGSRILAVVNAFYSMISRRPHRAAVAQSDAAAELRRQAGLQFDPEVVDVFLSLMKDKAFHETRKPRRTVLIASADRSFAPVARVKLEAAGIDAEIVVAGMNALDRLREGPPDTVLLDTELDDMTGFQLLYWMKQDQRLAAVPVLVISAEQGRSTGDFTAHDLGADDFILKPVRPSTLVARLNAIVRRRDRVARASLSQIHDGEGLRGSLAELSIPDLVNLVHEGRKTATVHLRSDHGEGLLTFDCGLAVHARTGTITGPEAFQRLFLWQSGDFAIEYGAATAERTIAKRMDLLLAEAHGALSEMLSREQASERRSSQRAANTRAMAREGPASTAERPRSVELTDVATRPDVAPAPPGYDTDSIETRAIDAEPVGARG